MPTSKTTLGAFSLRHVATAAGRDMGLVAQRVGKVPSHMLSSFPKLGLLFYTSVLFCTAPAPRNGTRPAGEEGAHAYTGVFVLESGDALQSGGQQRSIVASDVDFTGKSS